MVCVGLLAVSAVSLNESGLSPTEAEQKFNSINSRTDTLDQAIDEVWLNNRFVGGGLRYFTDPARPYTDPSQPGSSENWPRVGLIGLGRSTQPLLIATVLALQKIRGSTWPCFGVMALVLRVTQGLADIFWVAGPLTVALILVGMGLTADPGTDAGGDPGCSRSPPRARLQLAVHSGLL